VSEGLLRPAGRDRAGSRPGPSDGVEYVLESALRLSVAISQSRPAGSIPGTLLCEVGRLVARALHRRS